MKYFHMTILCIKKDKADNYGGVFVACACHELPLDTIAKVVACRIAFDGQQPLIILLTI